MSAQHARSVQLRRQEFGDEINYNLALCIALHMGNDGKPARLAISTLAEHGFCHYNTADKRTKEMAARGLIKITKQGKLFLYSIPGEYEDEISAPAAPEPANCADDIDHINGRLDKLESQIESLVKMVDKLHTIVTSSSHELHTNFTPPSHELHTTFTPPDNTDVNEVEKGRRGEEGKNPPNPPAESGGPEADFPEPFKPKYSRLIPPALQSNQFLGIWATYEEYHASSPKPLTEFTAKRQLKKMAGWGIEKAIAAMNHSMDNNYTGLIEPKASKNGRAPAPSDDPYFADIKPVGGLY